jgi:hypothetical protein
MRTLSLQMKDRNFEITGEHTRPRVFRPAPSRVRMGRLTKGRSLFGSRLTVFREGAENCTRGACASQHAKAAPT